MPTHALLESASGYAIFTIKDTESIGSKTELAQSSITDYARFSKMVSLISFLPFKSAVQALENANDVSEGVCFAFLILWMGWRGFMMGVCTALTMSEDYERRRCSSLVCIAI